MANQKTYSRRKKEDEEKKSQNSNQIDLIPKCVQQPRTRSPGGPKRRTDFSPFFCSQLFPSSSSNRDVSPESHSSKEMLTIDKHEKEIPSIRVILCCESQDEGERFSPEYSELRSKEAESSSDGRRMESTSEKLHHSGTKDICQTSLAGEGLTCSDSDNASINGLKGSSLFQDKLPRRGVINSSKRLAKHSAEPDFSDENPQSFDKLKPTSSSTVEGDIINGGRGKRKKKPKVHFDELTNPEESVKKTRRLKIMRYLGLAAPAVVS
ncbi:hypothetical protein V2J09_012112 [Rumex salicifolius]